MPRRKRRLIQRIKYTKKLKLQEVQKLEEKRDKLTEGKASIQEDGIIVYKETN